ncbi:hypothetical protein ACH492_22235 [Streptomyces sp. NPDC019443]|uniref:hypothetical protein n=1 Tax=Streptomyces sp. NPDC019443 TaxID=3365061 RepID=UPI0037982A52
MPRPPDAAVPQGVVVVAGTGRDPLVAISLLAGVGFTASAEYHLARTIGAPVPVAVLLPVALDVYVIAAIRRSRGRDIALSLLLMGIAQVSAHMLEAHVVKVSVPLVAAVSLLVPLVIWRVHALAVLADEPAGEEPVEAGPEVERVPVPETSHEAGPVAVETARRPELPAVPKTPPVPVRRTRRVPAARTRTKAPARSFEESVSTAREWLAENPELSGTDIGKKLGTDASYGRRVKRAALKPAS